MGRCELVPPGIPMAPMLQPARAEILPRIGPGTGVAWHPLSGCGRFVSAITARWAAAGYDLIAR